MKKSNGFTLLELMVVVAIVGILATVALPAYNEQVRKSRRADALAAMGEIRLKQEAYRANNPSYATLAELTAASGVPTSSYYDFTIADQDATGYEVTATAKAGTSQAKDTGCTPLTLNQAGAVIAGNASCFSK